MTTKQQARPKTPPKIGAAKRTLPMEELVPGAMNEAMLKGCLVSESDLDHGKVAKMQWGVAVKRLIEVRGGNLTYQQAYPADEQPVIAEPVTVEPVEDDEDFSDLDAMLAELDDEDDPHDEDGNRITPAEVPSPSGEVDLDSLLDEITDPDRPRVSEASDVPSAEQSGAALFIGMPTTRDYIFDGHAGAGPSGSSRWMNCTASLGASRAFLETLTPNQQIEFAKGSGAARQGTTAHMAAESEARLMLGEITEAEHEMTLLELSTLPEVEAEAYDEEMGEWLVEYGDLIRQYHQDGHPIMVEQRVSAAIPLLTVDEDGDRDVHVIEGSADAISMPIPTEPVLSVIDLKYGNGVEVEAEDNSQAKIYALAVLAMLIEMGLDIFDTKVLKHIELVIVQPRLGGVKTWKITVNELLDWQDDVLSPALTQALAGIKGGAKFSPSPETCQWCPARGNCTALAEAVHEGAVDLFDEVQEHEYLNGVGVPLETDGLTSARLAELLEQAEAVVKLKDDLKAEAQRRLHRGEQVPGFQLVNYQPPRQWVEEVVEVFDPEHYDEDVIDAKVIETVWQRKMLSPPQAVTALKAKGYPEDTLGKFIVKPDVRPVVAREGDRRKTWTGKPPEQMFPAIEED